MYTWLERAYADRDGRLAYMHEQGVYRPYRSEPRFIALEKQQPCAARVAIDREQASGLRWVQHLVRLSRNALEVSGHQKTKAVPFDVGVGGVSVQYGEAPVELLAALSACSFARSC